MLFHFVPVQEIMIAGPSITLKRHKTISKYSINPQKFEPFPGNLLLAVVGWLLCLTSDLDLLLCPLIQVD